MLKCPSFFVIYPLDDSWILSCRLNDFGKASLSKWFVYLAVGHSLSISEIFVASQHPVKCLQNAYCGLLQSANVAEVHSRRRSFCRKVGIDNYALALNSGSGKRHSGILCCIVGIFDSYLILRC